jgi:hypothetical protein
MAEFSDDKLKSLDGLPSYNRAFARATKNKLVNGGNFQKSSNNAHIFHSLTAFKTCRLCGIQKPSVTRSIGPPEMRIKFLTPLSRLLHTHAA